MTRASSSTGTSEASPDVGGEWLRDLAVVRAQISERLDAIPRVVAVMSGKGGVGKSAVSVHLAVALARRGDRVALLDADLHSPSVAKMLGLRGQPLRVTATGVKPAPGPEGIAVQSMDFWLQGNQALDWDGASGDVTPVRSLLEDAALADLLAQTEWGERDTLVIDLPPGADRLPALAQLAQCLTGALAVTIPTELSLLAVERSIRRGREAGVPVIGLVENMGTSICSSCGSEEPLFQEADVFERARELDVEVLARVPFDARLAAAGDAGRPFDAADSRAPAAFAELAEHVARFEPTRPVGGTR